MPPIFTRSAMEAAETGTGPPALALLGHCGLLPHPPPDAVILDNASGAGVVAARLFGNASASSIKGLQIVCGELSGNMVDMCAKRIERNGWSGAEAKFVDAQANPYEDNHFSHVLMNFGPQLMSDPMLALKETHRVLRNGGITGFTCWTSPGWIPSIVEVFPSFTPPPILSIWKDPTAIKENLSSIGFTDIKISTLKFETHEGNLNAYLELMEVLLSKLLVGENAAEYERHMKEKWARGETRMSWEALVVSAVRV